MEKRKSARFDVSREMKGKLLNVVSFVANNISAEGINLVSNFQPVVGSTYKIYLIGRDNRQQDFEIEISRAEVAAPAGAGQAALPPGLHFSIGARFKGNSEKQKAFLASFMKKRPAGGDEGFISRDDVKPGS